MAKPQEAHPFHQQELQQLKKLVLQGEGLNLEFKRKAAHPEKIVREMIAFANTRGGVLLVGVGDDKSVAGLKFPEGDSHVIHDALKKCKPRLEVEERFIPVSSTSTVIYYHIPESKCKPHYLQVDEKKESYVRVADQSIKASKEVTEIARRSHNKKGVHFYFGEHERTLMQYLDVHPTITIAKFSELTKLKRFYASKKLVLLVLAGVLIITPHERGDLYSLAYKQPSLKTKH